MKKSNARIEQEILAKKLNIPYYWKMKDKTLGSAIDKAKRGEEVTETPDVEPVEKGPDLTASGPSKSVESPSVAPESAPEPMCKAIIELKGGFTRQKSLRPKECDEFVEKVLDKGLKIVSDGKVRVYSPNQIVKIDITGLPS